MVNKEHFIKNTQDNDYSEAVRSVYNSIRQRYSYKARISQLVDMLRYSLGLKEFQLYDSYQISNGQFESYCIDKLKDFMDGKDVDFTELYEAILIAGDFLESEKKLLKKSDIEERLWAIYLAIIDQDNKHNI